MSIHQKRVSEQQDNEQDAWHLDLDLDLDLDATGEDWEYECYTPQQIVSELTGLAYRVYSLSEF